MEDEGRNRDYEHITKYFTLKFPHTPDEIGYCLGINSFIGNDSILILCTF